MSEPDMDEVCANCGLTYGDHAGFQCMSWKRELLKTSFKGPVEVELESLRTRLADAERERDEAVAFASKVERGEVKFAKEIDAQIERISKMPLGKTVQENLADAVFRVLTERDTALAQLETAKADGERMDEAACKLVTTLWLHPHYPLDYRCNIEAVLVALEVLHPESAALLRDGQRAGDVSKRFWPNPDDEEDIDAARKGQEL